MQVNQPKLPLRTLDPRILPRGPDFTPAFADFGRQSPGGRNVSGSVSLPQLADLKTGLNADEVHPQAFGPLPMLRWFWLCQDECQGGVVLAVVGKFGKRAGCFELVRIGLQWI